MSGFELMGLRPEIMRAIEELGYKTPTPIQIEVVPELLQGGGDMIGLAQTGTGKTAAFGLPLVQNTDTSFRAVQGLILSPTRELAVQIATDIESYARYTPGLKVLAVYGGANIVAQMKQLKGGVHLVAGTPGRVLDLISRRVLNLSELRWLVLDEADEMLNMGFKEELDAILSSTPEEKQTLLFSATMPREILSITRQYMREPREIAVGQRNAGADKVNHQYYMVHAKDRYEALKRIADLHPKIYGLVFCRTRAETKEVADKLMKDGYNADALHGDLSQAQRDYVMNRFRTGNIQLLVATDVAARGLDVDDLTHVIHYNLPDEPEIYIHRSGRTGRAGKPGTSIAIIHTRESAKLQLVEKKLGKKFERKLVPGGREICEKQLFNLIDKMEQVEVDEHQVESYLPQVYKKLEWMSREELIRRFVSVEFNRFLEYYRDAEDLNPSERQRQEAREFTPRERTRRKGEGYGAEQGFSRFFINMGRTQRLTPQWVIGMINDFTGRRDIPIGRIDIGQKFSFFEVGSAFEQEILKAFRKAEGVRVKLAIPEDNAENPKGYVKKGRRKDA
ncbi:MAG TPA: DEAD/DEAH box helicase [Bacteroidales bacterium]|nr:DEAD/DEAH box helicase [Bacteroidales bacterium]